MVVSKREQLILIVTMAAVAVLALDRLVLSSLIDLRNETLAQKDTLQGQIARVQSLMSRRKQLAPKWLEIVRSGLKNDPGEAESQVLHAFHDWSQEAGISLTLKPDRLPEKTTRMPEISFLAAGTGSLRGIARLLWRIETASFPIKTTLVAITSHKEGTDDLSFQIRASTVYLPPVPGPASQPCATSEPSGDR